jgi:hypothetical protein
MKRSFTSKCRLILIGIFVFSITGLFAQSKTGVYTADSVVKDKLEVIKEKLNLSDDQLVKIRAIDKQTEEKLEAASDNTAARKVYTWRDGEYKKVLSATQFKTYLKEKEAIVDEAQSRWSDAHATVIE